MSGKGQLDPGRVLIVDDSQSSRFYLKAILEEHGYATDEAPDGEKAFAILEHTIPDLILLDVYMPGDDGYEVCRKLRRRDGYRDLPVIFLSSAAKITDVVTGFDAGANDYLTKPFEEDIILARIRTHITLSRTQRDLQVANSQLDTKVMELEKALFDLEQTQNRLIEREKMTTMNTLIQGMSHEMGTPLGICTTATSYIHSLMDRKTEQAQGICDDDFVQDFHENLSLVESNLVRLGSIIKATRETSMMENVGAKDHVNLLEYLSLLVSGFKPREEDRIQFDISCPTNLEVELPLSQFYLALSKILDNAIIHGFPNQARGTIAVTASVKDNRLTVIVANDGLPLPVEKRESLLDPFVTTKRGNQGFLGLGLFVVYNAVIQGMGGSLEYGDGPQGGVEFRLHIPLTESPK